MTKKIQISVDKDGIGRLKMADEGTKNLFTHDFIAEFAGAMDELADRNDVKVLLLSGLKDVFCGGAAKQDLLDLCDGKVYVKDLVISEKLVNAPFPVIAAMEGHAVGGGIVMASCCDIVLAARESRYGAVFMSLGFTPGMGCTTLLQGLMGNFAANEMMYTAKRFKGSELEGKGTNINYILPKEEILAKAEDIASQISEKNIKSISLLKYALSAGKKKLLIEARVQEDFMHRLTFSDPATRKTIEEFYGK